MSRARRGTWPQLGLGLVAALIIAAGILELGPPASTARTSREVVTAERGVVQTTVSGTGNIAPGTDVQANFATGGTLSSVYVKVGQYVRDGQLIATLDPTSAQLSVDQAQLNLTVAEDQLTADENGTASGSASASTSTGPARTAAPTTAAARTSTTATTTTTSAPSPASIASAQAAVTGAELSLRSARLTLGETRLYAPAAGTIVSLSSTSPGTTVSAGTGSASSSSGSTSSGSGSSSSGSGTGSSSSGSLGASSSSSSTSSSSGFAEIVDTSKMTMTVAFSESDISNVKVGQPATVTLDALTGVELPAHVSAISTLGTTSSSVVSYDATLSLDANNPRVKPGMSASASVITKQTQGVNLPNSAVNGNGSVSTVNVLRNGQTVPTPVVVGLKGDSRTQIVNGLSAGAQVVVKITLPALGSSTGASSSASSTPGGLRSRLGGGGFGGGAGAGFGGGGSFGGAPGGG